MSARDDRDAQPIWASTLGETPTRKPGESDVQFRSRLMHTVHVDLAGDDGDATGITVMTTLVGRIRAAALVELRYALVDKSEWSALVTRAEDPDEPGFQLYFQQGQRIQKSGIFNNTKALVKFIRDKAAKKFPGIIPVKDTLDRLQGRTAQSVVPDCYKSPLGSEVRTEGKCAKCPYQTDCVEDALVADIKSQRESEPEELFLQRLRGKVIDQWGDTEQKLRMRRNVALDRVRVLGEGGPTVVVPSHCTTCHGSGKENVPVTVVHPAEKQQYQTIECRQCRGTGFAPLDEGD